MELMQQDLMDNEYEVTVGYDGSGDEHGSPGDENEKSITGPRQNDGRER